MEILELKPVKNKKIQLFLVKKENIKLNYELYQKFSDFMEKEKFRFAIIDFNDNKFKKIYKTPLSKFLDKYKLPYYSVDIPENVKDYLYVDILEKELQIKELEDEYEELCLEFDEKTSFKAQNLKSWIYILKKEVENKKTHLELVVKPQWIVKQILDIINNVKQEKFSILHFTENELFSELKNLFEQYNIKVIKKKMNNKLINPILI